MKDGNRFGSLYQVLKWISRVVGLLVSAFFLLFFFGEIVPLIAQKGVAPEMLLFLLLLTIAVAGCIVTLLNGKIGGILQIAGGGAMGIYHLAFGNLSMAMVFGIPFLLCGLLSVISRQDGNVGKKENKQVI